MTRAIDVVLDSRGWAQFKSRRRGGRRGLPWTMTEDRDLLRRVSKAASIGYADPTIQSATVAHERSFCSVATRISGLRAGIRLALAVKGAMISRKKGN